jgi:phosphopantetheine adenylyltransferase
MRILVRKNNIEEKELAKALAGYVKKEGITLEMLDRLQKNDDGPKDPIPEKYIRFIANKMSDSLKKILKRLDANVVRWLSSLFGEKSRGFGPWKKKREELPAMLTEEQMDELRALIESHFRKAIGVKLNVSKETVKHWEKLGINLPEEDLEKWIVHAYVAGRVSDLLNNHSSYTDMLKAAKKVTMNRQDQLIVEAARQNAARYIVGYGRKLADAAEDVILEARKTTLNQVVQLYFSGDLKHTKYNEDRLSSAEVEALLSTEKPVMNWRELSTELKNRFKGEDVERDWDRVAFTETRFATNMGRLMNIQHEGGGDPEEIEVYYVVQPNACKYCKKLYLEDDGTPKIFKLSDILENVQETGGLNIGLSASKIGEKGGWVPNAVLHPNCHCYPVRRIKGFNPVRVQKSEMIHDGHYGCEYCE